MKGLVSTIDIRGQSDMHDFPLADRLLLVEIFIGNVLASLELTKMLKHLK
jgi:hypothetical protein